MQPLKAPKDSQFICAWTRGSLPYAAAEHCRNADFSIILTRSQELERIAAEVELWLATNNSNLTTSDKSPHPKVVVLPAPLFDDDDDDTDDLMLRKTQKQVDLLGVLGEITTATGPVVVVADIEGVCQILPHRDALSTTTLKKGDKFGLEHLKQTLGDTLGYDCEALCEGPGQYAIRGGIIDVYPINEQSPYRVEFFGDEIDSIRPYDPTSQRTDGAPVDTLRLSPARAQGTPASGNFASYLPDSAQWILLEPTQIESQFPEEFQVPETIAIPRGHFAHFVDRPRDRWVGLSTAQSECGFFGPATASVKIELPARYRPIPPAGLIGEERTVAEREVFSRFVANLAKLDPTLTVFHRGELAGPVRQKLDTLSPRIFDGAISEGFILYHEGQPPFVALGQTDLPPYANVLTITRTHRRVATHSIANELLDFSQVAEGDYLVHFAHGICLYRGISRLDDTAEEVISLEFADGVILHLPLSEGHLISRYIGLSKTKPKLSRIGSPGWSHAKASAAKATADFAAELLRLQAVRKAEQGFAFAPPDELDREFAATFPYNPTVDQAEAIAETLADLARPTPTDRLVCGDVGFGKTEVALRAAFKAAASGKQVLVLCPTTILSQQHFTTFNERVAPFGLVVECLNRFRCSREQHAITKAFSAGKIDILVGTHRLLGSDIKPHDLGLVIIDEEHRFGVDQKEKLKRLRTSVDVIAMSATPIPRTLQLALGGARDLSLIETAPLNRRPIETIVKTFDEKLLRSAIEYETARGGQVFYLHNRVQTIAKVAMRLREMFPTLRIAVGHGRMAEEELEGVMTDFVAGLYDILVCTTIIESGLDIPNVNTLIIEGADKFGLAQLYQIRGRVGRFNRQAYAYLFLHPRKDITDEAHSRLEALRAHNELGAGFKIAMRDLELRGAGNLLGPQQSGEIAGVGFELYCQLLKESVNRLKLGKSALPARTTVFFDFEFPSQIPTDYIPEARLRLEVYRDLATAETLDALAELEASIADRFGKIPPTVQNLITLNRIRLLAQSKRIEKLSTRNTQLILQKSPDPTTKGASEPPFIKFGSQFPRLNGENPAQKVFEIEQILKNIAP